MADVRLIDANALLKEIEDWHDSLGGTMNPADWGIQNVLQSVMDYIIEAEDVDAVKVVHGRWELGIPMTCSACGKPAAQEGPLSFWASDYCHNCGAKMDEKEEDHEE